MHSNWIDPNNFPYPTYSFGLFILFLTIIAHRTVKIFCAPENCITIMIVPNSYDLENKHLSNSVDRSRGL